MDPGSKDNNDLAINFDLTMPELVCQFASMDVSDMMGTERQVRDHRGLSLSQHMVTPRSSAATHATVGDNEGYQDDENGRRWQRSR